VKPLKLKVACTTGLFAVAVVVIGIEMCIRDSPNHVLPTSRSARFSSGLGVLDFMKRTSLVRCDAASLASIGPAAIELAKAEGLEAHALSVSIRLNVKR